MLPSSTKLPPTFFDSLAEYPHWFVVACVVVVAAVSIWLLGKLLKWALWLALIVVLVGGGLLLMGMVLKWW